MTTTRRPPVTLLLSLVVLTAAAPAAHAAARPSAFEVSCAALEGVLSAFDDASFTPAQAIAAPATTLTLGGATLTFGPGAWLTFPEVAGRVREVVYVGRGRLVAAPAETESPSSDERRRLVMFTGSERVDEEFVAAVLACGDPERIAAILRTGRAVALAPSVGEQAQRAFLRWKEGRIRAAHGTRGAIVRAALGDPDVTAYAWAALTVPRRGELHVRVDPGADPPFELRHHVPAAPGALDASARIRAALGDGRVDRRKLDDFDENGTWDRWLAHRTADLPRRGQDVRIEHYDLALEVREDGENVAGKARLSLVALRPVKTLTFALDDDLTAFDVGDHLARSLPLFRAGDSIHVLLPRPMDPGERLRLDVSYVGPALSAFRRGRFTSLLTTSWYPRAGDEPSTYSATFQWSGKRQLFASGASVEKTAVKLPIPGTVNSRRVNQARYLATKPVMGFGFEFGDFEVETAAEGHVALTFAFARGSRLSRADRAAFVGLTREIVRFYEGSFGPLPQDQLTLVTTMRLFSQGMAGFITFNELELRSGDARGGDADVENGALVLAHEIAHQWWGNLVQPDGPDDLWLSEGMAEYAARLFARRAEGGRRAKLAAAAGIATKQALLAAAQRGYTVAEVGPVSRGGSVHSSLAPGAADAIVYGKGALVAGALETRCGEERWLAALRGVLARHAGGRISTATFLSDIARETGVQTGDIESALLRGTGQDRVYYRADDAGEGKSVKVTTEVVPVPSRTAVTARVLGEPGAGPVRLDAHWTCATSPRAGWSARAPYALVAAGAKGPAAPAGTVEIGEEIVISWSAAPPGRVPVLDPEAILPVHFVDESRQPADARLQRADDAICRGDAAQAELLLRAADAPGEPSLVLAATLRRVHVLASLDRDAEAQRELARAKAALGADAADAAHMAVAAAEARLLLRDGKYDDARRIATAHARRAGRDGVLLAACEAMAAFAAGDRDGFARLARLAEDLGADLSALSTRAKTP